MSSGRANNGGRFTSEYSDRALYDLVAEVAVHVDPAAPTTVSQSTWDAGRAGAGHPMAPSARAICDRLTRHSGRPHPWSELLAVALDPERISITRSRVGEAAWRAPISDRGTLTTLSTLRPSISASRA